MIGDNKSIIIFRLQNETQGKKVIIRPARKVLTTIFSEQTIRPNYLLLETARKNQSFFFFSNRYLSRLLFSFERFSKYFFDRGE